MVKEEKRKKRGDEKRENIILIRKSSDYEYEQR